MLKMNSLIGIILVGYKEKNLLGAVSKIRQATKSNNIVYVFDQHPIDHAKDFENISGCEYRHRIWDDMHGPAYRRSAMVFDNMNKVTHICIISPDVELADGWDLELMALLDKSPVVFSGAGKVSVNQKDLFSLSLEYSNNNLFNFTQAIDRNFIFAKSDAFKKIVMPDFLKYCGENEYLSVAFLSAGYNIMSIPSSMYLDNGNRTVENTYHTFSLEHNYNIVVDILSGIKLDRFKMNKQGLDKFLEFHGIGLGQIKKLPYNSNDVDYDPYDLKMHKVDARRFISGTKAIY